MTRYIAFLRGINVSGQKLIKMETLRQYFEIPGFQNIATYIQSGNVLFDANITDESKLRAKIERQLSKQLGYDVPVIIRSVDDIKTVINNNPFKQELPGENRKLYVYFLTDCPDRSLLDALDSYKSEYEELQLINCDLYFITEGIGKSKLSNSLIEKKLQVISTARNWATINKIVEL